ncbi:adenylate kinase [Membranicola marinus]|uniref:Adenylate kinase n=1 Tax=Membranihabitans marinus TaxID=1227546 RepID=A0A953HST9_9BACT|nr:adenylate kinase [Membranihabitans marinus]MBY5957700.1 adenylate kinase [Membranihabitans marinus]
MINLILFGPPGSGKGTQAKKLAEKYNVLHISTGDLFRKEIGDESELGQLAMEYINKGELVPDRVTIDMLRAALERHGSTFGVIYDGFPRTVDQARALDVLLEEEDDEIDLLISLQVDDEEIIERILERGKTDGRADDQDESIIRDRIAVYKKETQPVYAYYDAMDKSMTINGTGSIEDVFNRLTETIDQVVEVN